MGLLAGLACLLATVAAGPLAGAATAAGAALAIYVLCRRALSGAIPSGAIPSDGLSLGGIWPDGRRRALGALPLPAVLLDGRGRIVDWNAGAEDLAGGALDWTGRPFTEALPPADRAAWTAAWAEGTEIRLDLRLRGGDGMARSCRGFLAAAAGGGRRLLLLQDDSAGRAAAEREARLALMAELSPHLSAVLVEGRIAAINPAGARLLGAGDGAALAGRLWADLHLPAEADRPEGLRRLDGATREVEMVTAPTFIDGRPATLVSARDITPLAAVDSAREGAEQQLRGVLEAVGDAVILADEKGTILLFNGGAEQLFGWSAAEMVGHDVAELMTGETARRHGERLRRLPGGGEAVVSRPREGEVLHRDGRVLPVTATLSEVRWGRHRLFTVVLHDQTELRLQHARLSIAETVMESTSEGVVVTAPDGTILWVNRGFSRISGYTAEEVVGKTPRMLKSGVQGGDFYQAMWRGLAEKGEWSGEIWNRRKDGEVYPEWLRIRAVRDEQGRADRFVGVFSDISRYKRAEETIRHLTYYDSVTRLPNRHLFQDRISQGLERARRGGGTVAVALVSLDRFKTVNETLGHQVGDELLREVASRLSNAVRAEDTVCRLRGDSFCCGLTELARPEDANPAVNRMLDAFAQPYFIAGQELFITASLGISLFPLDGDSADELIQKAETAMNRSKERAETCCEFYTPAMNANSMERLRLETDLRKAIHRGELQLHFQPKVDTASGRLLGAEALIRWRHPELGMVPPSHFIPIAEATGLILPIGTHVLREACNQIRLWRERGLPLVRIAVNLSAHQFRQPDLVDSIRQVLEQTGVPAALIGLELTESCVMHNADAAVKTLERLHEMGFEISIDDFGTGYSSLSYLTKFPIDRLKVDRSFVQTLGADEMGEEIVGAIVAMAHSLKMEVVAEGVETSAQLRMLADLRCDEIQGYYFSRPLPADDFAKALAAGRLNGKDDAS